MINTLTLYISSERNRTPIDTNSGVSDIFPDVEFCKEVDKILHSPVYLSLHQQSSAQLMVIKERVEEILKSQTEMILKVLDLIIHILGLLLQTF